MRDRTQFDKEQIVGARMAGASVSKTGELLSFSRATVPYQGTYGIPKVRKNVQKPE